MSKTARLYQDTRAANAGSNLDRLNDDLQDVTRIMTKNMEELLWRGDSLDSMCFRCGLETPCVYHVFTLVQECRICQPPFGPSQKSTVGQRVTSIGMPCCGSMPH